MISKEVVTMGICKWAPNGVHIRKPLEDTQ